MATSDPATDYWPKDWKRCPVCGFLLPMGRCAADLKACAQRTGHYIKMRRGLKLISELGR